MKKQKKRAVSNGRKITMRFLLVNMDNLKVLEPEVVLNFWVHLFLERLLSNAIREVNNFNLKRLQQMKLEISPKLSLVKHLAHLLTEKYRLHLKSIL